MEKSDVNVETIPEDKNTKTKKKKLSRSAKRKFKKKKQKKRKKELKQQEKLIEQRHTNQLIRSASKNDNTIESDGTASTVAESSANIVDQMDVEWESAKIDFENTEEAAHFQRVFSKFNTAEDLTQDTNNSNTNTNTNTTSNRKEQTQLEQQLMLDKLSREYGHESIYPTSMAGNGLESGEIDDEQTNNNNNNGNNNNNSNNKDKKISEDNEMEDEFEDEMGEDEELSNRAKKELSRRTSMAKLKQMVKRPDLVQEHDYNSPDALLLMELKGARNTVPVPPHWSTKRKYLQGKRGFLKPPFKLPLYIEETGITKMREARLSQLSDKSMKQLQRDRVRPKTGAVVIEYETLHNAFFKHQTKPYMTQFGDIYYENKEFRSKYKKFKPGYISDRLKKALGMSARYKVICPNGVKVQTRVENTETGEIEWNDIETLKYGTIIEWEKTWGVRMKICAPVTGWIFVKNKEKTEDNLKRIDIDDPPPFLIAMQRFGPPPSYPDLSIPGLNAPIPPSKQYGFHKGQWGKPPVDETGQPLYGDPFGIWTESISRRITRQQRWGMLQTFDDESSSSEEEDSDIDSDEDDPNKLHPSQQTGIAMLDEATLAAKKTAAQALAYEQSMKLNVNGIGATGGVGIGIGIGGGITGIGMNGNTNLLTNNHPSAAAAAAAAHHAAATHAQSQLLPSGHATSHGTLQSGISSDMSLTSTVTGMMTPSEISLRKHGTGIETPSSFGDANELSLRKTQDVGNVGNVGEKRLYKVLESQAAPIVGRFGTDKVYIMGNGDNGNDNNNTNNNNNNNNQDIHSNNDHLISKKGDATDEPLHKRRRFNSSSQQNDDRDKEYTVKF